MGNLFFAIWASYEIVSKNLFYAGSILWPGRSLFDQNLCITHVCFVEMRLKYFLIMNPQLMCFHFLLQNARLWRVLTHFWIIKQHWAFLSNTIFHSDSMVWKIASKKQKGSDSLNWNMYSRIIPNETPVKMSISFSNKTMKKDKGQGYIQGKPRKGYRELRIMLSPSSSL